MTFKTKICVCNNGYCNTDMWIHDCIINKKKPAFAGFFYYFFILFYPVPCTIVPLDIRRILGEQRDIYNAHAKP